VMAIEPPEIFPAVAAEFVEIGKSKKRGNITAPGNSGDTIPINILMFHNLYYVPRIFLAHAPVEIEARGLQS